MLFYFIFWVFTVVTEILWILLRPHDIQTALSSSTNILNTVFTVHAKEYVHQDLNIGYKIKEIAFSKNQLKKEVLGSNPRKGTADE